MKKIIVVIAFALFLSLNANAQKCAVGTNLLDWANLVTVNASVDYPIARHLSLIGEVRWNGFKLEYDLTNIDHSGINHPGIYQNRKFEIAAGVRYWPWHVLSGFNVGGKLLYKDYANSGMYYMALEKGKKVAAAITAGYSIMLTKNLNLEIGVGGYAGYDFDYRTYDCPVCLRPVDRPELHNQQYLPSDVARPRWFADLENVYLTVYYIFL